MDIRIFKDHADKEWVDEKIGAHGGAYYVGNGYNSRASIKFITGVSKPKIFWYNIQLFMRYFMRRRRAMKNGGEGK